MSSTETASAVFHSCMITNGSHGKAHQWWWSQGTLEPNSYACTISRHCIKMPTLGF